MKTQTLLLIALVLVVPTLSCLSGEDRDGDGYRDHPGWWGGSEDCNDSDPSVYPGAPERCDGRDNNCNDLADEDGLAVYRDADGDGIGAGTVVYTCSLSLPEGLAFRGGDCDDRDPTVRPGAPDLCDGRDNDCDGVADDGATVEWWIDADGDGLGTGPVLRSCDPPPSAAWLDGDCDDDDPSIPADGPDACDPSPRDTNCDGVIECPLLSGPPFDLTDAATPIPGASVAPVVPVALTDEPGLVVFRARLSGSWVESFATFADAPVDDPSTLHETLWMGRGTIVLDAVEWTDVDADGWNDVAVVLDRSDGYAVVVVSGEALRGTGAAEPYELLADLGDAPRLTVGPGSDGGRVLVVHEPGSRATVFRPDAVRDGGDPSAVWTTAAGTVIAATSGPDPRLLVLAPERDGDRLTTFTSAEIAGIDDATDGRSLFGRSRARVVVGGPPTASEAGGSWALVARRTTDGLQVGWLVDSLTDVLDEGAIVMADLEAGDPVGAWATGRSDSVLVVVGSADMLFVADWSEVPALRFRIVNPVPGVVVGARLVRLAGVGPGGADAIFVSADGPGPDGWLLWPD